MNDRKDILKEFNAKWGTLPLLSTEPLPGSLTYVPKSQMVAGRVPEVLRVSQMTRYFYCDEETRGRVMEGWKAERPFSVAMSEGTDVHDWLEARPKSKGERVVNDKLEAWKNTHEFDWYGKAAKSFYRPITYDGYEVKIVAHPDNLRLMMEARKLYVQIEEVKTVERLDKLPDGTKGYSFFKRSQAEFQLHLYRWAFGWILPQIGEEPYNDLVLSIYKRPNGYPLKEYRVAYMGDTAVEAQIRFVFDGWTLKREPIVPKKFKCDRCDPGFKSNCRIAKSGWTFGKQF